MSSPPTDRPRDARWPTALDWLQGGPRAGQETADLLVLGVPTFATSLSRTAAHTTPKAVRQALGRLSTWSTERRLDLADVLSAADRGDVDDPDLDADGEFRVIHAVSYAVADSRLAVLLGGDNSLTAPALLGAAGDRLATAGLVTLDAHHDLREGRSNGSPVRRLLEAGLDSSRVAQVGIADWANSRSYGQEAHARGLLVLTRAEVARRGVESCVGEALAVAGAAGGPVYVDLDLDVCDRAVAPGCPASLPGGLSAAEALAAAHLAGLDPRVVAVDVTEVDAGQDPDGRTVRLAAMCLLEAAAGLALRPAA